MPIRREGIFQCVNVARHAPTKGFKEKDVEFTEQAKTAIATMCKRRMSISTASSLCRETDLSFQVWRDRVRAFAAMPLLADGKPLAEIADILGYETA